MRPPPTERHRSMAARRKEGAAFSSMVQLTAQTAARQLSRRELGYLRAKAVHIAICCLSSLQTTVKLTSISLACSRSARTASLARRQVQGDKVEARFKNGVLSIALPKTEQTQSTTMRISINGIEGDHAAPAA